VQLVSKVSNLRGLDPDPPTLQTDGQTDGHHAIAIPTTVCTKVHRAVKINEQKKLKMKPMGLKNPTVIIIFLQVVLSEPSLSLFLFVIPINQVVHSFFTQLSCFCKRLERK